MSKLSNELTMIKLISNRKYSCRDLSNILEVTERMIRIYKEDIEQSGFIIETTRGKYGGYKILEENSKNFLIVKELYKHMYNDINTAIKNKNKMLIEYYDLDNKKITKRIIHPYNIYPYNDNYIISAYCELRNDMRQFEFNRIKNYIILKEFF